MIKSMYQSCRQKASLTCFVFLAFVWVGCLVNFAGTFAGGLVLITRLFRDRKSTGGLDTP